MRSLCPILPNTRPSGEVMPSMAQTEPLGLKAVSIVAYPSRPAYCVAIWPFAASCSISSCEARKRPSPCEMGTVYIFVTELVPITFPEEKLEPPPPPETKVTELFEIVENNMEVTDNVSTVSEDMNAVHDVIWIPPVVETETVVEDVIHVSVEVMPEFIGGTAALMKYLSSNIKYPTISQETGSQGKVIVQFVVDKDGTISNPEVVRGVDPYLDKEAIRVISSMPKWTPGVQNGKKVRVKFTVPVSFRLQ